MKRLAALVAIIAVALLVAFLLTRPASCKRTFTDGSVMVLSDLKIASTNVIVHGTFLQKTLGQLLTGKSSLSVGHFKLSPPETLVFRPRSNSLFMQFHLLPGSSREASFLDPPFFRNRRILLYGDDGFPYVTEIISGYGPNYYVNCFRKYGDGVFGTFEKWTYPRDSKTFHFRLQERISRDSDDWHELATFDLPNPHPIKPEHREIDKSPRFKFPPGIEVEIGDLVVRDHPTNRIHDIYNPWAYLSTRISRSGHVVTNWGMFDAHYTDAVGNSETFGSGKTITNGWITFGTHRPLDPATPWHFKAAFGQASDYPATNLFTFTTSLPVNGQVLTNFGPYRAQVTSPNRDALSVELIEKPEDVRIDLVSATNEKGWTNHGLTGGGSQHRFVWNMNSWLLPSGGERMQSASQVNVTIAIDPIYWSEFTLQPRYEK